MPLPAPSEPALPLAAIALGSNLPSRFGPPAATLGEAVRRLGTLGRVEAVSSYWQTAPVGLADQPDFLNAACLLRTALSPRALLAALLEIERRMGRVREGVPAKGPRAIDLDLLLFRSADGEDAVLDEPGLCLPHPEMHRRLFVLGPLGEIAPGWVHPVLRRTVAELAKEAAGTARRRL